jgi:ABC-2 type transport system permease protein
MIIVMLVLGVRVKLTIFFTPIPLMLLALFSLGFGLILSTLAVYFPDVAEMYQIVLTAWMYLTPVIYPEEILPENIFFIISTFNPMYSLMKLFRLPIYYGRLPTFEEFLLPALIALIVFIIGWLFFTYRSDEFAYKI